VVAQRGGDCATLIENGENGMLADTQEEWEGQLELLLASAERRQAMGEAGYRLVAQRNSLAAVSASLEAELEYIRDRAEHNPALEMFRKQPIQHPVASPAPGQATASASAARKILIGCDFYWPSVGGVETIVKNLGLSLKKLGYEVEIAARALPNRTADVYEGMPIHSLDADTPTPSGLPRASLQLRELVESGRYAGVILRADPLNWVIWSLEGANVPAHTRTLVQPLINEDGYGNWGSNASFRQRLGAVLRQTSAVVCLTQTGPDARYMKEEGIPFVHLPNATTPLEPNLDFRQTYGFAPDKPLLVHVANLWPVKNHPGLIESFRKLGQDYQLALLGNPSGDLEYARQVQHIAAQDPRIKLLHGLSGPQVAAAMQAADLVVLASHGEVFPVSIVEAMSHGKACAAPPMS
jgi:glycosyltransferase involved in cell wall biosynthesis